MWHEVQNNKYAAKIYSFHSKDASLSAEILSCKYNLRITQMIIELKTKTSPSFTG
jgi:hypothetical protein